MNKSGGEPMEIDERKFQILKALIDDYIMTAAPVGSRTISRKSGVGYSPATIRNEMSDLEELGYLAHIHTSSGRIPSHKAYRLYVDKLMQVVPLTGEEAAGIRSHFSNRAGQVEEVVHQAAQVLSDVTKYTSIVTAPQAAQLRIKRLQVVPVTPGRGLMVIVTNSGLVRDAMINYSTALEPDHLYMISKMLTEELEDKPLNQLKTALSHLQDRLHDHDGLFNALMNAADTAVEETSPQDLAIGGPANMLQYPEYSDVDKARTVLKVFENREMLAHIMRGSGRMEFSVRIGPENDVPEMKDCSVVTATYRIGDDNVGTIGIVGPTRMNYSKVIAVLDYMGKSLSDMLSGR
jgi:heat-inducible transcriptional repressor